MTTSPWYDDHGNVAMLLRDLEERCEVTTVDGAIDVAEKPWKWQMEWDRLVKESDDRELTAA
jgi:hypothetical protein